MLIAGEPGIGKTRTAEELATYAQVRGAKVHWGRCHEGEGAPAYWPWVQVIRSYVREADPVALAWEMGSGAADIARVVPEVAERVGEVSAPDEAEDEAARFRLFDSISGFLASASTSRPLVIVLDDLHWADEPSLLLLQFLARGLGDARLLLIGTYRDVELGRHHPLSRVLGELSGAGTGEPGRPARPQRRGGAPLHRDDRGRRAGAGAGPGGARPDRGQPVLPRRGRTAARRRGHAQRTGDGVAGDPAGRARRRRAPPRPALARRPTRRSRWRRRSGATSTSRCWRGSPGPSPTTLEAALAGAVSAQLLAETSAGRYRFSHALVRETLYEELSAAQRPALHRQHR